MSTNAGTTFTGTCQVGLGGEVGNACARLTSGDKHESANISIKIHWHCEGLSLFGRCEEGFFFALVESVETYCTVSKVLDHMDDPKKIRQLSYLANFPMYTLKASFSAKASSTHRKITTLQSRPPKTNG